MNIPATARIRRPAWLVLVPLGLLAAGLLVLPAGASASNTTCRGHITAAKADEENDNPVAYAFTCAKPITAYTIVSAEEIDSFESEVFVFSNLGQIVESDAFSCEGDIPGNGINCKGTYGADQRVVQGTYDLSIPVCREPRTRPQLVITDSSGAMAGPFALGRPRGCPKSSESTRSKSRRRSTRRKSTARHH
jgi:hypothetical protein